jgi:hypothetical protein
MSDCLISDIQHQNLIVNAFIEKNDIDYVKTGYLIDQNRTIINANFYLFWIYFCLVLVYAYVLFTNGKNMTLLMRVGLLSVFFVYPFVITNVEVFLWKNVKYLYDTMVGNVYVTPDY